MIGGYKIKTVDIGELKKISYLDSENLFGRIPPSYPYKDENGEWCLWIPFDEKLVNINAIPAEMEYIADTPELDIDIYLPFLNFLVKRVYYPKIKYKVDAIKDDFLNLCTLIAKFNMYATLINRYDHLNLARFASTEIEYLFILCRSMFDILQEIIAEVWEGIELVDSSIKKKNLPSSFVDVFMKSNKILSQSEIADRYGLPEKLSAFYVSKSIFFLNLRKHRDNVVHNGKPSETIFIFDNGFGVERASEPFRNFNIWKKQDERPNNIVSLKPFIYYCISETLSACNKLTAILEEIIQFRPSIIPNKKIFTRGGNVADYLTLERTIEKNRWW